MENCLEVDGNQCMPDGTCQQTFTPCPNGTDSECSSSPYGQICSQTSLRCEECDPSTNCLVRDGMQCSDITNPTTSTCIPIACDPQCISSGKYCDVTSVPGTAICQQCIVSSHCTDGYCDRTAPTSFTCEPTQTCTSDANCTSQSAPHCTILYGSQTGTCTRSSMTSTEGRVVVLILVRNSTQSNAQKQTSPVFNPLVSPHHFVSQRVVLIDLVRMDSVAMWSPNNVLLVQQHHHQQHQVHYHLNNPHSVFNVSRQPGLF